MPVTILREQPVDNPIVSITANCRVDGDQSTLTIEDFDEGVIYLKAVEQAESGAGDYYHDVGVVLTLDEAEAFFNAGLEYVAQERRRVPAAD